MAAVSSTENEVYSGAAKVKQQQQLNCGGQWTSGSELDYICTPVK